MCDIKNWIELQNTYTKYVHILYVSHTPLVLDELKHIMKVIHNMKVSLLFSKSEDINGNIIPPKPQFTETHKILLMCACVYVIACDFLFFPFIIFTFTYMCKHCLCHLPPHYPHHSSNQAEPVLPSSLSLLKRKCKKIIRKTWHFWYFDIMIDMSISS
jgi:hypothetical protein